jgi:site-specific DNA-methyltransferase (adenine-specific)
VTAAAVGLLPAETSGSLIGSVHLADCLELCERVYRAGVRVDMIACDLPYGVTENSWDSVIPLPVMWEAFKEIVKPNHAIVLTSQQPFTTLLIASNMQWFKYSWVWVKTKISDHLNANNKPLRRHEDILVFSDGTTANCSPNRMAYYPQGLVVSGHRKFRPNGTVNTTSIRNRPSHVNEYTQQYTGYPDTILSFPNGNNDNVHPTQKPVTLFQYLIRTYTLPGEIVFDPCVGSGTTAVAARELNRRFIVGDSSPEYVQVARDRLDAPYTPSFMPQLETASA